VRTVRGIGYRFDRHADVVIRYGHGTPSPDRFLIRVHATRVGMSEALA
jgi:hypothetical protein